MPMKNPPHPGLSVRHDCLEPLDLSVSEAARKLGISRKQLSDIVNCRSGISPEMAIRLDKAFGGGADTWYRLQSTWELAQALKKADQNQGRACFDCRLSPEGMRTNPLLLQVLFRRRELAFFVHGFCQKRPGEPAAGRNQGTPRAGKRDVWAGRAWSRGDAGKWNDQRGELRWLRDTRARCWRQCTRPRSA